MGFFFGGFEVIFFLMFFLIFGLFLFGLISGIARWNKNNHAPRLTVNATVVAKRANVSHHTHTAHHNMASVHTSSSTSYYVTFEVESGDRMELLVGSNEFGLLVEGDVGRLSFQGTRYLGFERTR